jgi:HSP20 family protein
MSMVRWDPLREIEALLGSSDIRLGLAGSMGADLLSKGDWTPRVDIAETDKSFVIKMEIPEVDKNDVKVSVDHGVLSICGERKQETEEQGKRFHRMERYYGSFDRSFTLPNTIDQTHLDATFKDGMLTVELPKLAEATRTPIEVQIH